MVDERTQSLPRWALWVGPALFLASLVLYLATISPEAFPGESSSLIVRHVGLGAFDPLSHFIWGGVARVVAAMPFGSIALNLNVFSAFCAALCVWLLYGIVARIEHDRTFEETMAHFDRPTARLVSGIVAALFLMVSLPFWIAATRAHTLTFDLLLILVTTRLYFRYASGHRLRDAYVFALVYGLSTTEFESMIAFAPLFAVLMFYELWKGKHLTAGIIVRMTGLFTLGLAPYFIGAWRFMQTPAYAWRSFNNYFEVLWYTWREQYLLLMGGMPKVGWLMILFTTFLPWVVLLFRMPGRPSSGKNAWGGSFVLCGVLTVLAGAVLFNATVSPWGMTHGKPLLVTPYMLAAMWAGYLGGYWYFVLTRKTRAESSLASGLRKVGRWLYFPAVAAFFVVAGLRNLPVADGKDSRIVAEFARHVVDNLQGRAWLVTDGLVDDQIALEIEERQLQVRVIDTTSDRSRAYRRYVADMIDDPRLKTLAYIGLVPLLNEWIAEHPEPATNMAVVTAADLWYAGPYEPRPEKVLFMGMTAGVEIDADTMLADHKKFWDSFGARISQGFSGNALIRPWAERIRTHVSKVSNNLGVLPEDRGRPDAAFEAYQQARLINTNNISALLNLHALAKKEGRPELSTLEAEVAAFIKKLQARYRIWSLAHVYGYVRYPEAYAQRGWAWVMSGKPNMAISDMRRALELSGTSQTLQLALANLYLQSDQTAESEKSYLAVLESNPDNIKAIAGMARVSMQKSDFESARGYLARLEELKVPATAIAFERAVLESMSGNPEAASDLLKSVAKDHPDSQRVLAALAAISAEINDQQTLDQCLEKLEHGGKKLGATVRVALAQIALSRGDTKSARKHLDEVLRKNPSMVPALELILTIDAFEGQRDLAEEHVDTLLGVDPKNALGNYMNGTLLAAREKYTLAESAFRTSLDRVRAPETLNDLAWVLLKRGGYDEAIALARESLALNEANGSTWDTLGSALMHKGQLEEAREAIQKALALKPNSASIMLNMAMLYEKMGMQKDALRLADTLLARPSEISRESYEELRELMKRLRAST